MIKTRFAPSPTGMMHIGGVRTALYAYLVARKNNGVFSLRIEDTDRKRLVQGATEDIIEGLKWLGLNYDNLVIQSEHKDLYKKHAKELVDKGFAYEKEGALWFKMPKSGKIAYTDLIGNRKVEFENSTQKDFVILKSDGFPTYHLAHVVDDHLMETNPVIRAEEWMSSVPKHIVLFKAFGWEIPSYAHLPLILGTDRSKLSKRHGAKSVGEFKNEGFLPEAILNYMALLGWTPPSSEEIIHLEAMIQSFDLKDVHATPAVFDIQKLEWMNGMYIRQSQNSNLKTQIYEFYEKKYPEGLIQSTVPLIKDRIRKLSDYLPICEFFFEEPKNYEIDLSTKKSLIEHIYNRLEKLEKWQAAEIGNVMQKLAEELKMKNSEFFMILRVLITGKKISPPLNESMELLGKEKILERIKHLQI